MISDIDIRRSAWILCKRYRAEPAALVMKKQSLTAAPIFCAMMVICGAVKGDGTEECRNIEVSLAVSSTAVSACRRLADQGDALAQYNLGQMYKLGHGVQRNPDEAVRWFHKAAHQDNAKAQYYLAFMYERGRGCGAIWCGRTCGSIWLVGRSTLPHTSITRFSIAISSPAR